MLTTTAANIPRIGIMFDADPYADRPFPRLADVITGDAGTAGIDEHLPYRFPVEDFPGWMVVALDPRGWMYGDEDQRAVDVTNWEVIADAAGPIHRMRYYDITDADIAAGHGAGAVLVDGVLLVAPPRGDDDGEQIDRIDALAGLAGALADYPVLDDDAYSEREAEAWNDFAADGLRSDTIRDMPADMPEETVDAIDNAWPAIWPAAMAHLDYWSGFTGEHGPDFGDAVARTLVDRLFRFFTFGAFTGEVNR